MAVLAPITNPIIWQETKSQQRRIPAFIRRWWLTVPIALIVAYVAIALTLSEIENPTRDLAIHAIWIFQIMMVIRALVAGATAISREHTERTWEPLIMTGISARHILIGKWWGVMHHVAPWMFGLGALRLMMLPVLMLAFINRYAWWTFQRGGNYSYSVMTTYDYSAFSVSFVAWAAILAVVFTVMLTVLEAMSAAAVGVAAGAVTRRSWLAMIAAFCVRFLPVAIFALVVKQQVGAGPSWRILRATPLALADSGSASLYQMVLPRTTWTQTAHVNALGGILLAAILLTLLLVASLVIAWAAIRASGALPREQRVEHLANYRLRKKSFSWRPS